MLVGKQCGQGLVASLLGNARVLRWRCLGTARASSGSDIPSLVRYIPRESRRSGGEALQSVQFPGSCGGGDEEELDDGAGISGRRKRTARFYYDDTEKQRSELGLASYRKRRREEEFGKERAEGTKEKDDRSEEEEEFLVSASTRSSSEKSRKEISTTIDRSQDREDADEEEPASFSLRREFLSSLHLVPASKLAPKPRPKADPRCSFAGIHSSTDDPSTSEDDCDESSASPTLRRLESAVEDEDPDELGDEDLDASFALEVEKKKKTKEETYPDSAGERSAARNYAIFLLSKRQRTAMELRKKLGEKNYPSQAIESTIAALLEEGLQSDASYAEVFAQSRWNTRGWGPKRIKYELSRKGVDAGNIDRALQKALQTDENGDISQESDELRWGMSKQAEEHILALATRKWSTGGNASIETRSRRLAGWLQRRGFSWKVINGIISRVEKTIK